MTSTQSGTLQDDGLCASWNALLATAQIATPFHRLDYLRALESATGVRPWMSILVRGETPIAGVVLFRRRRFLLLREVLLPPVTPCSAILLPPNSAVKDLRDSQEWLLSIVEEASNLGRIHLTPIQSNLSVDAPWESTTLRTYVSDIRPEIDVTSNWSTNPKRTLRKNADRYVTRIDNTAVDHAARLNRYSYSRHDRSPLLAIPQLKTLVQSQVESGAANVFVAENVETNETDAAAVILESDGVAYYWVVGSVPGPAMTVLLHFVLRHCSQNGLTKFDWVGANTPSIADFKRRFGPTLVDYQALKTVRPGLLRSILELRRTVQS